MAPNTHEWLDNAEGPWRSATVRAAPDSLAANLLAYYITMHYPEFLALRQVRGFGRLPGSLECGAGGQGRGGLAAGSLAGNCRLLVRAENHGGGGHPTETHGQSASSATS